MAAPQQQTISSEIKDRIQDYADTGIIYPEDHPGLIRLEHEAKQLSKVDMADGYTDLAAISMLRGNYGQMWERIKIAKNNGAGANEHKNFSFILTHAGFTSDAADIIKGWVDNPSEILSTAKALQQTGQHNEFLIFVEKYADFIKENLSEADEHSFKGNVLVSRFIVGSGISQKDIHQLYDTFGEIFRNYGVYPKTRFHFNVHETLDAEFPHIIYTHYVPVSYDTAADMTWDFAERVSAWQISSKILMRFIGEDVDAQ